MSIQNDGLTEQKTRFTAELQSRGDETVVALRGEVDVAVVPALQDTLALAVEGAGPRVDIDLTMVTFLDPSGIGRVVDACKRIRDSGRAFSVTCVPGMPRRALEVVGLIEFLNVRDHLETPPSG